VSRDDAPAAWILRSDAADVRIWGLTPEERLRRSLVRAGCGEVHMLDPDGTVANAKASAKGIVLVRGNAIFDERLISALVEQPQTLLLAPELGPVALHVEAGERRAALEILTGAREPDALASVRAVSPDALAPAWLPNLRKSEPPYVYAAEPSRVAEIERRTFAASYKGVTDLVTKWVWPRPAASVTGWCARLGVTPNTVTIASWVLAGLALWLFLRGDYVTGLVMAWAMTFLDTVDGKLARVTLTSSRLGDVLDHGLDLLHPPFWYLAWGLGLSGEFGDWSDHSLATGVVVAGYVVGRLLEGAFLAAFRFETHSWRPLDAAFRTVTARRNPNLLLLTVGTAGGRPDLGLLMVALWTLASLLFHVVRLGQAFAARRRGEPVAAWDARESVA